MPQFQGHQDAAPGARSEPNRYRQTSRHHVSADPEIRAGVNRAGAGRLQEMANLLGVTPAFFFEDGPRLKPGQSEEASGTTELLANKYNLALAQAYNRIRSRAVRRNVLELVEGLAESH